MHIKKKNILLLIFILYSFCSITAQEKNFIVTRDTIHVNIEGALGHSLMVGDKFYCFFQGQNPNGASIGKKKMYIISSNGRVEHCIDDLPEDFQSYYPDFHLRNDSILYKIYYGDRDTYLFEKETLKWKKISTTDDLIYEDDKYYVTSLDFGEWGDATWFRNKATGTEYQLGVTTPKVNRLGDSYFLSLGNRILEISDPRTMQECSPEEYYRSTINNRKFYDELYYDKGAKTIYLSSRKSYFEFLREECPMYIRTSFVSNKKLYHLLVDSCKLYIAVLEGENLKKINTLATDLNVYSYSNNYRSSIQKDGNQTLKFTTKDEKMSGLMKIKGDTIALHYITNDFREKLEPRGKELADAFFQGFFSNIFSNYNNKNIYEITDYQKNENHAIPILDDDREIDNSRVGFSIVEDSVFVHEITYMYSQRDSLPKRSLYIWKDYANFRVKENEANAISCYEDRFGELKQFITQYLRKNNLFGEQSDSAKFSTQWVTNTGITIDLHAHHEHGFEANREIRLFIGYGKKQ